MHENREWLAVHAPLRGPLRGLYGAMGVSVTPPANLSSYQLRQWGVTGDPNAAGTLRVRASILNTAAQLQPYPLLRVTLANRFGTRIGARDFEPAEYLGKPTVRMLAPGERADAILDILDPGKDAEGFEIDVCLRGTDQKISCAADAAPQAAAPRPKSTHDVDVRCVHRTLPLELQRRARADGGRDRPAVSHAVPQVRRGPCRLRNADLRCAPLEHAKSSRRMDHRGEPSPRIVQIAGFDPEMMAEAARRNVDAGAQIIDINMGCPAKKVCNRLSGSALLRDELLVARILQAVVGAVDVPVTLKTRTGWDRNNKNGIRIARIARGLRHSGACDSRPHSRRHVSGNGRARDRARHQGESEDSGIRERRYRLAAARARHSGRDRMRRRHDRQGRARPAMDFRRSQFFHVDGKFREELAREKVRDIMRAHLENLYDFYGDETGVRVARKHLSWYFRQHPGQEALRNRLVRIETPREQLATLLEQFDTRVPRAA